MKNPRRLPWPELDRIQFEETPERVKITLPVRRQWPYIAVYSILLLVWLGALFTGVTRVFSARRGDMGTLALVVWIILLLLLAYLWYRLGAYIWRWWTYSVADREIIFIDDATLILRRPVSIFGVTDAYDRRYIAPFFFSEKHDTAAFRYGNKGVLFGQGMTPAEREALLEALNGRYYPDYDDDE